MRQTLATMGLIMGLAAVLATAAGCKQDAPKPKYVEPIEGIARDIDPETGRVSMEFQHAETGLTVVRSGYVSDKTSVEINGRVGRIEEIGKGERVKVTGYQIGSGEDRKFIVTRISVNRPTDWIEVGGGATSAPATEAAR